MKTAIVGTGGIGGYFGGLLADKYANSGDNQIFFISRGRHLKSIAENGLKVITSDKELVVNPDGVVEDPSSLGELDLVIFTVKSYDLEAAAKLLYKNINSETVVITLLNGVNNAEVLEDVLPECRLCNGCVYISSRIEGPGVVRHVGGPGKIFFGPVSGDTKEYEQVEKFLTEAGISAELTDNITVEVWKKYMFMSPFAGVTALKEKTFGEVLDDDESRELLENMIRELETLARKKGVDLPDDIFEQSLATGSKFPPATKSSMQLDFELEKKSELQVFVGYVVEEARKLGVEVPSYVKVYSTLSLRE